MGCQGNCADPFSTPSPFQMFYFASEPEGPRRPLQQVQKIAWHVGFPEEDSKWVAATVVACKLFPSSPSVEGRGWRPCGVNEAMGAAATSCCSTIKKQSLLETELVESDGNIMQVFCLWILGRREKTPTPNTRFSIWTLLRTPGRFTFETPPCVFYHKNVCSKAVFGPQ